MTGFCRREESGFTLVEILVAIAILMIGLVAVMQWYPMGTAGVETGRRQSIAVFLAEQKIEQIKAWSLSTTAGQGFATVVKPGGTCANAGNPCADDGFNTIAGYPEYSRTVTIVPVTIANDPTCNPSCARTRVRVQVQYRRVTVGAVLAEAGVWQVDFATLIAQH